MTLASLSNVTNMNEMRTMMDYLKAQQGRYKGVDNFVLSDIQENNIRYLCSTFKRNIPYYHFFVQKEDGFSGLFRYDVKAKNLERLTDTSYRSIEFVHHAVWDLMDENFVRCFLIDNKIMFYDCAVSEVYTLGAILKVLHIMWEDKSYLLCIDCLDSMAGLFSPKDEADFKDWYFNIVYKYGQSGMLDGIPISQVIHLELNCRGNAFINGNYEQVELEVCDVS